MIASTRHDLASETRLVEDLLGPQVDGIIATSVSHRPEEAFRRSFQTPPVVPLDASAQVPGYAAVGSDGEYGGRLAVDHLIGAHGHTRIGLVMGGPSGNGPDSREAGWRHGLEVAGLLRAAHERGLSVPGDLAVVSYDGTQELEYSWPPLTVVAQPNEEMAKAAAAFALDPGRRTGYAPFRGALAVRRSCGCQAL